MLRAFTAQGVPLVATACPLLMAQRYRAHHFKIANRKSVEMFVGQRFHAPTRLRTAAPDVAAEWDYEKNPGFVYPEIVGIGHMEPVWWRCGACGHQYSMSVEKRVVRGRGCPQCEEAVRSSEAEAEAEGAAAAADEEPLEGERNPALRPKRPTMLNMRTKY